MTEIFTTAQIQNAKSEWFGNNTLYQMCQIAPDHQNLERTQSKIWLIGRAYSASLERRRQGDEENPLTTRLLYQQVATALQQSELDKKLDHLRNETSITAANLPYILELHTCWVQLVLKFTHNHKTSLASKYLHFHLPQLFYIYDTRARAQLKIVKQKVGKKNFLPTSQFPNNLPRDAYHDFVFDMLALRDYVAATYNEQLTPRQLDNLLLG